MGILTGANLQVAVAEGLLIAGGAAETLVTERVGALPRAIER